MSIIVLLLFGHPGPFCSDRKPGQQKVSNHLADILSDYNCNHGNMYIRELYDAIREQKLWSQFANTPSVALHQLGHSSSDSGAGKMRLSLAKELGAVVCDFRDACHKKFHRLSSGPGDRSKAQVLMACSCCHLDILLQLQVVAHTGVSNSGRTSCGYDFIGVPMILLVPNKDMHWATKDA